MIMKAYAQFLERNRAGEVVEALGSDGVFVLDARTKLSTMKIDAMVRMHNLRHVQSGYLGYRIYYGDLKSSLLKAEWRCR